MTTKDWVDWHRSYDDPDSHLSWRLRRVQERISRTLDRAPAGRIKVASLCAGDGRDLLDVLADHPRTNEVEALPGFCRPGTTVIWTRHRRPPDLVPTIRRWFAEAGFAEALTDDSPHHNASVTSHRYTGPPTELRPGRQLFHFH